MQSEEKEESIQVVVNISRKLFDEASFFAHQNNIPVDTVLNNALNNHLNDTMITYIMGDDTGLVKIGRTKNLDKRFKELSSGNPTLRLLFEHDGDIENRLHKEFSQYNVPAVGTEWFKLSQQQIEDLTFREHFHMIDENDWEMFLNKKNSKTK